MGLQIGVHKVTPIGVCSMNLSAMKRNLYLSPSSWCTAALHDSHAGVQKPVLELSVDFYQLVSAASSVAIGLRHFDKRVVSLPR